MICADDKYRARDPQFLPTYLLSSHYDRHFHRQAALHLLKCFRQQLPFRCCFSIVFLVNPQTSDNSHVYVSSRRLTLGSLLIVGVLKVAIVASERRAGRRAVAVSWDKVRRILTSECEGVEGKRSGTSHLIHIFILVSFLPLQVISINVEIAVMETPRHAKDRAQHAARYSRFQISDFHSTCLSMSSSHKTCQHESTTSSKTIRDEAEEPLRNI